MLVRPYLYMARIDAASQLGEHELAKLKARLDVALEEFVTELGMGFHTVTQGGQPMQDLGNLEV